MLARRLRQCLKALKLLGHPQFRRGLSFGIGASIEHRGILHALACATVVDIGANRGQFSLLARGLFPQARIHAFEPLQHPADLFERLFRDDPRVTLHRSGIGPKDGPMPMNVSGADDSSSLLTITDAQVAYAPGTQTVGTEMVTIARLDSVLRAEEIARPALLKLDVQGYELAALQGCGVLLASFDAVYVEVSFAALYGGQAMAHDIVDFLHVHGFYLSGVNNAAYATGPAVQSDFLFERPSLVQR